MPVCVFEAILSSNGAAQPLVNDMEGGSVIAKTGPENNSSACTFVLLTPAEYERINQAVLGAPTGGVKGSGSLLDLSPEQAMPVAAAVFGVWAVAWAAKQAIRTLRGSDEKID